MKRILVTGGGGFVGKAFMESLAVSMRYEVHATFYNHLPGSSGNVVWHKANMLDSNDVEMVFSTCTPTYLVQLAWCSEHGIYWRDPLNIEWLRANLLIAQKFIKYGGSRCLFAGTSAEYDWSYPAPLNEFNSPLNPKSLYGGCKLASYWALLRFFEQEGISLIWARFFNPFGPNEDIRRLIPKTCQRLLRGERIYFDAGLSIRDFLYIKDVGLALSLALEGDVSGPVNIASGTPVSIREVVSQIARFFNCIERVEFTAPDSGMEVQDTVVADTRRLQNEIGFSSKETFNTRLEETCRWWADKLK